MVIQIENWSVGMLWVIRCSLLRLRRRMDDEVQRQLDKQPQIGVRSPRGVAGIS